MFPFIYIVFLLSPCALALRARPCRDLPLTHSVAAAPYEVPTSASVAATPYEVPTSASVAGTPYEVPTSIPQPGTGSCAPYWLENIKHQGVASFNTDTNSTSLALGRNQTYQVFRNVKEYGAAGDGRTDDTAAIQKAISDGGRCAPGSTCQSTTKTPAVVYFPQGTYMISSSIIDYYCTQIIGNPNCLPTILAAANFSMTGGRLGLIDGSPYQNTSKTGFGPTNTFFRQIRNLIFDMTRIPANVLVPAIHWPTAQTTSLQNLVFNMSAANGTQHEGIFVEEGSGGFMADLVFHGGNNGFNVGNQQFTTRNLTFINCVTAINQLWSWGWTYKSVTIVGCQVGLNISAGGPSALKVGSITLLDSSITNTSVGILTARTSNSEPAGAGSVYLENVKLDNVEIAVAGLNGTVLPGSRDAMTIQAWADGHRYISDGPIGPVNIRGDISPTNRSATLLENPDDPYSKYLERSKPQYGDVAQDKFLSARTLGAKGDGHTDDTHALNAAILQAQRDGKILFVDAGFYLVNSTIYIPPGSKIVGEALASVILSNGSFFNDMNNPQPVVQVALGGERGSVEWSDMFVSTKGQQAGAVLIEWNLGTYEGTSGMWDVHTRIGGFAGSDLQTEQCEKTPDIVITPSNLVQKCIAAYISVHVTKWATGLYMENVWLWTADHDLDDSRNNNTQITIYAGRGLLIESLAGRMWLYGTAVEHHVKYEYQFVDTHNIFMGQIQTETAYYQPNPDATIPFPENATLSDPLFTLSNTMNGLNGTNGTRTNTAVGWGLRILRSSNITAYGVGLYSFFDNYSTNCSAVGSGASCQTRMLSIEGYANSHSINLYNLNTVGATQMVTRDGVDLASNVDNNSTFVDTINVFRI
ncbi:exo-beta-1,3-glucanase-like protein [Massariosphaeria phaeospora]|uniref:Exo-beta-1,3-glucanase-like protein n=1 Tax=Massariosphaeria phaeospora TaxID=100035 RepID=A0A7C8IIA0_9PLEO|nr:exo-beta-1,3-glucanase-like protein [Massariosphaeria phaeospora]